MRAAERARTMADRLITGGRRPLPERLAVLATIVALTALFFRRLLFSELILPRGDVLLYFYPYWQAAADALRAGRLPLWNPYLFTGAPFLANSQAGVLYPLNWPLWLALPTPYAASASIGLHIVIGGLGTYFASRRWLRLSTAGALFAAALFSFGGYLTAQVEHLNQLQGLAWLPWALAIAGTGSAGEAPAATTRRVASLSLILAMQLLAGHIQTAFITVVAALIVLLTQNLHLPDRRARAGSAGRHGSRQWRAVARGMLPLLLAGMLAFLIAAAQLLPTLELAQLSSRQGGLPPREALSFSLHPLLLARALLPGLGQDLYTEYVAWLPVTAWLLAILAAGRWRQSRATAAALALTLVGLMFGLGLFSPLYQALVRLPGFDLFRVPARWLALTAVGAALLAGVGWDLLWSREGSDRASGRISARNLRVAILIVVGVIAWGAAAGWLARFIPGPPEQPLGPPTAATAALWVGELALGGAVLVAGRRPSAAKTSWLVVPLAITSLFAATRSLPYNNPTAPEAFLDMRPPAARLLAATQCAAGDSTCSATPGRLLSMSDIFFDVGDQSELDTIYADQLPAAARYDLTVAIKHQEVIGPNLPLAYGLASVDGFDGGILPLKAFTQLMSAMTGQEGFAADGRLREYLDAIPAARWLDLLNVGYVITDKVGDTWHQGKFFDQQHPQTIEPNGAPAEVGHVPAYEATELWLIAEGPAGSVQLETTDGRRWELEPTATAAGPLLVRFPTPAMLDKIVLQPCHGCGEPWDIAALTLVDGRDDTFQPLVLGSFRLIHSGDVKIYENLDVLPRAFVAPEWRVASSTEEALRIMADEAFDPAATAVLTGSGPDPIVGAGGQAAIIEDRAEQVRIQVTSAAGGLLVLTDADYPGWEASIDGERAPNYTADVLFRGVWVPAGHHEVTFRYAPGWMPAGFYLSFLGVVVSAAALTRRRNRPPAAAG